MSLQNRILIVGTGAIGGFFGGKLAQTRQHVTTLCRSDYQHVKHNGISITSPLGDFHFSPDLVIDTLDDYPHEADFIIITAKVLPEANMVDSIKKTVGPNTSIVLLQNGINIEKPFKKAFPENTLISGLAFICISRTSPGKIIHQDYGRLIIGDYPNGTSSQTKILADLFIQAGIDCHTSEDIITDRWKKLIWNAPFNPLSVLCGQATTKELLESPETINIIQKIMNEVVLLSEADGHAVNRSFIAKNLDDTKKMTPYETSMLLDYKNKRPMEVEAILGQAVAFARKNNIPVPYMESLYGALILLDKKNRG